MTTVKQIERMVRREGHVLTISTKDSVADAAKRMNENDIGSLIVMNTRSSIVGILTERDIIGKVVAQAKDPTATNVTEVMTKQVVACGLDTSVTKAQRIMAEYGIRHLPIIEEGVPVGMISSRDVLAHQLSTAEALARQQFAVLQDLEGEYPGITKLQMDNAGRVVF